MKSDISSSSDACVIYGCASVVESVVGDIKIVLAYFSEGSKSLLEEMFSKPKIHREFIDPERHYNWKIINREIELLLSKADLEIKLLVHTVYHHQINREGKTQAITKGFEAAASQFALQLKIPLHKILLRSTRKVFPSIIFCRTEKFYQDTHETKFLEWYAFLQFRKGLNAQAVIYPQYDWQTNGGRTTKSHILKVLEIGPCRLHHREFINTVPTHLAQLIVRGEELALPYQKHIYGLPPSWWIRRERFIECIGTSERRKLEEYLDRVERERREAREQSELPPYSDSFIQWLKDNW